MNYTKWWKQAVIYEIYLRSFYDSNGDGVGDLQGIIQKLDYIKDLGVDAIWVTPFYQSPLDDMGYDISDYCSILLEFGTMEDFERLVHESHRRGIKVVIDMVLNHTSDEHPWFVESRSSKTNPRRDWYVWHPGIKGDLPNNWQSAFQGSAWEYDELTGEYYLHQFSKKQPDLNWRNPQVREAMFDMIRFWLDKGVDGLRLDIINSLIEDGDFRDNIFIDNGLKIDYSKIYNNLDVAPEKIIDYTRNQPETYSIVRELRNKVIERYKDIFTVGEAYPCSPEVAGELAGEGKLDVCFHFDFLFLNKRDVRSFKEIISRWEGSIKDRGPAAWNCYYLSNHDMPRQVSVFGSEKYYKESAAMLAAFLLTLPGTIFMYQGEEIGMTDVKFNAIEHYRDIMCVNYYKRLVEEGVDLDTALSEAQKMSRDNARTPMQWSNEKHGGFTMGTPWLGVNENYRDINVRAQQGDTKSILSFYKTLIKLRKDYKTLVYGSYKPLLEEHQQVMAYIREDEHAKLLVILNMSEQMVNLQEPLDGTIDIRNTVLLIANTDQGNPFQLKPFEVRIYLV